jgi:hypothetical protein
MSEPSAPAQRFRPGTAVSVVVGGARLVGTVVDTYGPEGRRVATVRVQLPGPPGEMAEDQELSFPESALRPLSP